MEANELIERYVNEVGQNLPRKGREDIKMELRSLLLDDLDGRTAGQKATEEDAVQLLREYGPPQEMAANYHPKQALIGPQLFPIYKLVLLIVLAVMAAGIGIALVMSLATQGVETGLSGIWGLLTGFAQGAVTAVGSITIIFAALERFGGEKLAGEGKEENDWDPLTLPAVEDPGRVNRAELITEVVVNTLIIIVFNFYPYWLGLPGPAGESAVIPLFSPEFAVHIPWLTVQWGLAIILSVLVLRDGHWSVSTRIMQIVLKVFEIVVTYRILTIGAITRAEWLDTFVRFGLIIALVVLAVELVLLVFRLLTGRATPRRFSLIGHAT